MDLLNLLGLCDDKRHVVALVGSGGKTTLLYKLCDAFHARGVRTAALTTTHIMRPAEHEGLALIINDDTCLAETCFTGGKIVLAGTPGADDKLEAPQDDMLDFLLETADVVISEADGAHTLPVKFPSKDEPVLLPHTTDVFVVAGLSALGQPLCEVCHRWPLAMAACGFKGQQTPLTADMLGRILAYGYGRYSPAFVLNQADDEEMAAKGAEVKAVLCEYGFTKVFVVSLKEGKTW
ncbi:MAG: selenium cofactor biosynthesis protein YqeC [Oscillospiraceae bacterium]